MAPIFCGTWTRGLPVAEVAERFGADASTRRIMSWDDVWSGWVLIGGFGEWLLALECQTHRGGDEGFLASMSRGGAEAVNYRWHIDGISPFEYAADGELITGFDVANGGGALHNWYGRDIHALDPYLEGLPFPKDDSARGDEYHFRSHGFAVIERMTGGRLDPQ
ncbi:DUF6461 domain-containing protein [Acrocarpospora pleiomorpha]|nr:DUF6461 domain-containing protein [Acrocarpospora pleiomorpha]